MSTTPNTTDRWKCGNCGVYVPYTQTHSCYWNLGPRTVDERQPADPERIAAALEAARGA